MKDPLLSSRSKIVSGEVDVPKSSTDESPGRYIGHTEFSWRNKIKTLMIVLEPESTSSLPNTEEEAEAVDAPKGIPGYWAQCLVNHPAVEDICTHEGELSPQRHDIRRG